jgi:protein gp37
MEPPLGPIDIGVARPDWIIAGGESGRHARFIDHEWVRSLCGQSARNGVAFHHKQRGGLRPKQSGYELDGREYKEFPTALAA